MTSVDGQPGMRLQDFIALWTSDGTKLTEEDKQELNDATWILYSVYFPDSTQDYGRHMAMLLKVSKDGIILKHDLENLSGTQIGGGHRDIKDWFLKHVGVY